MGEWQCDVLCVWWLLRVAAAALVIALCGHGGCYGCSGGCSGQGCELCDAPRGCEVKATLHTVCDLSHYVLALGFLGVRCVVKVCFEDDVLYGCGWVASGIQMRHTERVGQIAVWAAERSCRRIDVTRRLLFCP